MNSIPCSLAGDFLCLSFCFFAASPHPCAGPQYQPAGQATQRIALGAALPLHPPAGFFSPPGSIAVRRAVNIYYQ